MLQEYTKVLKAISLLDQYSLRVFGKRLADIHSDIGAIEELYRASDYCRKFNIIRADLVKIGKVISARQAYMSKAVNQFDIDISRRIDEMSDDDLMHFVNMIKVNHYGDFALIRYNDVRCYNNILLDTGEAYNVYEEILRECRSVVIDLRNMVIVSLPYYKFMNRSKDSTKYPEYSESAIISRMSKAKIVEFADKMDGSFIQITWIGNKYPFYGYTELLTSSKHIDDTPVVVNARAWYMKHANYQQLVRDYPDYTVMFESISFKDRHIVIYDLSYDGLWLIGMRHKVTGRILSYLEIAAIALKYGVRTVKMFSGSYDELINELSSVKGTRKEGYVANIDGFLVKMKSEDYLEIAHVIVGGSRINAIIRAVARGSVDDLIASLPDFEQQILEKAQELSILANSIQYTRKIVYERLKTYDLSFTDLQVATSILPDILRVSTQRLIYEKRGRDLEIYHPFIKRVFKNGEIHFITQSVLEPMRSKLDKFNLEEFICKLEAKLGRPLIKA